MSGIFGYQGKLLVGSTSAPTNMLEYISESLKRHRMMVDVNGLRGTRTRYAARARPGLQPVVGQLSMYPTPVELAFLLPWILGGTPSGTSYPLAELIPTYYYWALRGTKIFKYPSVGVSRATLSARQGEALNLTLDLVGTTEDSSTTNTTEFTGFDTDITTHPFMFHELVLNAGGSPYSCRQFQMVIDNAIDGGRFFNSQSLKTVQATDRVVSVSHDLPYGDSAGAYGFDQDAGVALNAIFTSGGTSLSITSSHVQYEDEAPTVLGRQEVMLPLAGVCRGSAALNEITVTLDSTP